MNKPLYCFRLNDVTGEITKYIITDYEHREYGYRKFYKFTADLGCRDYVYIVREQNINKFVSNKVFTFNPNVKDAMVKILNTIKNKKNTAEREANRCSKMMDLISKMN
jgi:hypothetical protein